LNTCSMCGLNLLNSDVMGVCNYHHAVTWDGWAKSNKVMCDFIHRGKVPKRRAMTEDEWLAFVANI
jgi:hypothetical protein